MCSDWTCYLSLSLNNFFFFKDHPVKVFDSKTLGFCIKTTCSPQASEHRLSVPAPDTEAFSRRGLGASAGPRRWFATAGAEKGDAGIGNANVSAGYALHLFFTEVFEVFSCRYCTVYCSLHSQPAWLQMCLPGHAS